jgi:outer membrane protein OmpA-like peptidoglycan-associated protein
MFILRQNRPSILSILFVIIYIYSFSIYAQDSSDVITLQKSNPTSSDIIGAFMHTSEEELPEGLMDNVGEGNSDSKYRGISFGGKLKPEMATNKSLSSSETCPANNAIAVNINFKLNSSELDSSNITLLHEISKAMNSPELSACNFIIEGHTDALGDANYNMNLSKNRAIEVKNFLANIDVRYSRMEILGKGESDLIIKDNPNDARNRRVQFRISN